MDLDAYERRTLGGGCFIYAMTVDDLDRDIAQMEKAANSGSV
jgi:hypothetical protein